MNLNLKTLRYLKGAHYLMNSFEDTVSGKWILAGEHSVLRGVPALVFPLSTRSMQICFAPGTEGLKIILKGEHGSDLEVLVRAVIGKACENLSLDQNQIRGTLTITSNIPIGAGMGASAALCVCISKWLSHLGFLNKNELFNFSKNLENLFHGESSGVDIAVSLKGQPLLFERNGSMEPFSPSWKPYWYLSYTGHRGVTLDCVKKVKELIINNPTLGAQVDHDMHESVRLCIKSLSLSEPEGLPLLIKAIDLAKSCFERWDLIDNSTQAHMGMLINQGALSVKPTGSGGGGFVLSLWSKPPPEELRLIPC